MTIVTLVTVIKVSAMLVATITFRLNMEPRGGFATDSIAFT